jgi:aminopeptidase YwaD
MNWTKNSKFLLAMIMTAGTFFSVQAQQDIPGIGIIKASEMMKTITYLASPQLEGRQPGSDGYYQAAAFMEKEFTDLGLKSLGDNGYFQNVSVEYVKITENPELFLSVDGKDTKEYKLGKDFVCRGQTGFGDYTANVVFCGYGISEPQAGYDDYAGMDVKGKIVLVFKQNPSFKVDSVDFSNKYNRYRANVAANHGAVAMLLVSTPLSKNPQPLIGSIMDGEGTYDKSFPQLHIDIPIAQELMQGIDDLKQLQQKIDSLEKPSSIQLKSAVHINVKGEYYPERNSMNVIGILQGSNPKLKDEYIVISAHLDHVGKQGSELYFPGANDNASGSAAVLQMARAFSKKDAAPDRSVIFVLYTSEEQGLLGSAWFASHCPVPVDKIVAAINMDCIAFGDSIQVGNGKANPVLWNIARFQDSCTSKMMVKSTWNGGGADLDGLYKAGVPGLYFVTKNSYTHLHLPTDKPETLNQPLYESLVKLAYRVAFIVSWGGYHREALIKP